jgi:hypothetical protein
MDNPLSFICHAIIRQSEVNDILFESSDLDTRIRLIDEGSDILEPATRDGRDIMIDGGKRTIRTTDRPICSPEPFEGLWGSDFVHEVGIDED